MVPPTNDQRVQPFIRSLYPARAWDVASGFVRTGHRMNLTEKPALTMGSRNDADEDGLRVRNPCTVRGAVVERFIERPTVWGDLRPDLEEVIERDGSRQGPQARQASTHWRLPYFEIRIRSVDEKSAGAVVPLNWRTGSPTSALGRIRLTVALMMEGV